MVLQKIVVSDDYRRHMKHRCLLYNVRRLHCFHWQSCSFYRNLGDIIGATFSSTMK